MSLIDLPTSSPLSLEDKKAKIKLDLKRQISMVFDRNLAVMKQLRSQIWSNRDSELTPQVIFDAFGSEAVDLFIASGSMQDTLNKIKPGSDPFEAPAFEIHSDGTVTVL